MSNLSLEIQNNYARVLERVAAAARGSGRKIEDIKIVVVSKGQPVEKIKAALEAGITQFGENYPEEALEKIHELPAYNQVEWHMIGHLQSRKAKIIVETFSYFHSLDRISIADKLQPLLAEKNKILPVLLEMNVGEESSKNGWQANNEAQWDLLLPEIERLCGYNHLLIRGLMTMPPLDENPLMTRPYFLILCRLRDYLAKHFPQTEWRELSMGTSADYEIAVEEGATFIRVGQAILGPRNYTS